MSDTGKRRTEHGVKVRDRKNKVTRIMGPVDSNKQRMARVVETVRNRKKGKKR